MKRGYLINIENPNFSGIAILTFCSAKPKINKFVPGGERYSPRGKVSTCYTESGHGVRQLASALGSHFEMAPTTKLIYTVDEMNLLSYFEVAA